MKKIRSFVTMFGLSLALLTLGVAGARAQDLARTEFHGSFNLPVVTQWGSMTLPAGNYNVYYGPIHYGQDSVVEIVSEAKGGPHGFIPTKELGRTSATNNSLVCMRDGTSLVVEKLDLPTLGKSVSFAMPRGRDLLAQRQARGKYTVAKEQAPIQRISVNLNEK